MEQELTIIVTLTKWMMYVTAVSTWALRFLIPSPDDFVGIFGVKVAPHRYLVLYNILRWVSGNKSWQDRGPTTKMATEEIVPIPATDTTPALIQTTKLIVETKPDREERKEDK